MAWIREPDVHLQVGSASHGVQTGKIMAAFEETHPGITVEFTAIPYYAWDNRGESEMSVWLPLAH